jgi:hypothetical protein
LDPRGLVGDLEQNAILGTIFVRIFICGLSILSYQSIWVYHFYFIIWYTTVLAHLHPFHHSKNVKITFMISNLQNDRRNSCFFLPFWCRDGVNHFSHGSMKRHSHGLGVVSDDLHVPLLSVLIANQFI